MRKNFEAIVSHFGWQKYIKILAVNNIYSNVQYSILRYIQPAKKWDFNLRISLLVYRLEKHAPVQLGSALQCLFVQRIPKHRGMSVGQWRKNQDLGRASGHAGSNYKYITCKHCHFNLLQRPYFPPIKILVHCDYTQGAKLHENIRLLFETGFWWNSSGYRGWPKRYGF